MVSSDSCDSISSDDDLIFKLVDWAYRCKTRLDAVITEISSSKATRLMRLLRARVGLLRRVLVKNAKFVYPGLYTLSKLLDLRQYH